MEVMQIQTVVVGAGVVGLACAAALAQSGREVILLEQASAFGHGVSSRNSEVIHAGIYYPPDSLKAELCVAGRDALYAYCERKQVKYQRIAKLIVATQPEDMAALEQLYQRGVANGVEDLHWLSAEEAQAAQPGLQCLGALASPSTGIIDSHGLMLSLLGDLEEAGGMLALGAPLLSVIANDAGFELEVGGEESMRLQSQEFINCAGLYSVDVAQSIQGLAAEHIPETVLAKGSYFRLQGKAPFTQLIYPAPVTGGLGVHLTIDLGGQVRFGPDVEFLYSNLPAEIDYTVSPERAESFYAEVRRYWPELPDNSLLPDYSGVRPKVAHNGVINSDFEISTAQQHGITGLVNLFGIESPGLTASLALAERVTQLLDRA